MGERVDYRTLVLTIVTDLAPRSLLAIGAPAAELAARYRQTAARCTVVGLSPSSALAELPRHGSQDLALLDGAFEELSATASGHLLAALRDVYARQILAVLRPHDHAWRHQDMISHGLTSLGRLADGAGADGELELFEFDIATYKTTPDWLNNRNWANPELFDKYRW